MSKYKTINVIMIIYAFIKAFPLGIMVLAYLMIMEDKVKNLEKQIMAGIEEDKKAPKKFKKPKTSADKFIIYKDCIVEKHCNKYYVIKPSGNYLEKTFNKVEDATSEIDIVAPFFPPKEDKRQKIQNIRFVRW